MHDPGVKGTCETCKMGGKGDRWKNIRPSAVAVPANSAFFLFFSFFSFGFGIAGTAVIHMNDHHPLPPKMDNNILQHVY